VVNRMLGRKNTNIGLGLCQPFEGVDRRQDWFGSTPAQVQRGRTHKGKGHEVPKPWGGGGGGWGRNSSLHRFVLNESFPREGFGFAERTWTEEGWRETNMAIRGMGEESAIFSAGKGKKRGSPMEGRAQKSPYVGRRWS